MSVEERIREITDNPALSAISEMIIWGESDEGIRCVLIREGTNPPEVFCDQFEIYKHFRKREPTPFPSDGVLQDILLTTYIEHIRLAMMLGNITGELDV